MDYPSNLKHVAMYLRKSRADMEAEARGEGETLAKHKRALLEIAKKYGYTIDRIYEEIVSGERIADRPEMQKLLEAVKNGDYQAVLCMDIDRLGRGNLLDQGTIYEAFKMSKTLIITPRKVYDLEDEYDEEWTEFEAFMARRELKIITRRLQRGRRLSARDGRWVGKKPPYGYVKDENLRLSPDPDTAPIVRMIFEMRAQGMGRYAIARKLDDLGIPTPSGGLHWEAVTVRDILNNEAYIGRIVWGQYKHDKDENGAKRKIRLPRDQWIVVEKAHEPIVTPELWENVQKMNDIMNPKTKIDYRLKNPFAGLMRCVECGKVMFRRNKKNRKNNTLLCVTYKCNTRMAVLEQVEQRLLEQLEHLSDHLPKQDQQDCHMPMSTTTALKRLHEKLKDQQDEIDTLRKQQEKLFDLLEQGIYGTDTFLERSRKLEERIGAASRKMAQIQKDSNRLKLEHEMKIRVVPAIAQAAERYKETTDAETKNRILKSIIEEIRFRWDKNWPRDRTFELEIFFRV